MGIGVDVGSTAVRVVAVERRGSRLRVTGVVRRRLPVVAGDADGTLAQAHGLRAAFADLPTGGGPVVVGITGRDLNLQYSKLPAVAISTLRKMVRYEVGQQESTDGMYADHCLLRGGAADERVLVLAKARRDMVDRLTGILEESGFPPRDACPHALALYNAYLAAGAGGPDETALLIDIGAVQTEMAVVRGRGLVFARNIQGGGRIITEAVMNTLNLPFREAERFKLSKARLGGGGAGAEMTDEEMNLLPALRGAAGKLAKSVQSSLSFARVQLKTEVKPDRIVLSGGGALLPGLAEFFQGTLGVPTEIFRPMAQLDLSALGGDAAAFEDGGPDFAVALGLAAAAADPKRSVTLSLLPDRVRKLRRFYRTTGLLYASGLVLALTLGLAYAAAAGDRAAWEAQAEDLRKERDAIRQSIEQFKSLDAQQRDLERKVRLALGEAHTGRRFLERLSHVRRVLPPGLWLTRVALQRLPAGADGAAGATMTVEGMADASSLGDPASVFQSLQRQAADPAQKIAVTVGFKDAPEPGRLAFDLTFTLPGN